jgi:predicted O-methyltransferase YrrM
MIPRRNKQLMQGLKNMVDFLELEYDLKQLKICEIGSWCGSSADLFARRFKHVFCIDPWESSTEISTKYNMKDVEAEFDKVKAKHNNIFKIKHFSYDIADEFEDKSFDIVYIDGEHSYQGCKKDIELYLPKARLYITGHDYWPKKFPGVVKAVNELIGKPDRVFKDTSWIKKIK